MQIANIRKWRSDIISYLTDSKKKKKKIIKCYANKCDNVNVTPKATN